MSTMTQAATAVAYAKAFEAVAYVLEQHKERPFLAWYLNGRSFELLTEAFAAMSAKPVEEIEKAFQGTGAVDPAAFPELGLKTAMEAINHVLNQIKTRPEVAYYMGAFTASHHLLCKAMAVAYGEDVKKLESEWLHPEPLSPKAIVLKQDEAVETIYRQEINEAVNAEREALRFRLLNMLDRFPCYQGITWQGHDEYNLLDALEMQLQKLAPAAAV